MLLVLGVALAAAGLYAAVRSAADLRDVALIVANDPIDGRELLEATEPVEFEGTARASSEAGLDDAPFSDTPSLCWSVRVQRFRANQGNSGRGGRWETVDADESRRPFVVDLGTARAAVDPEGATLRFGEWRTVATECDEIEPRSFDHAPALAAVLGPGWWLLLRDEADAAESGDDEASSARPASVDIKHRLRMQERRLEPGDAVHVYGARAATGADEWGSETDVSVGAPDGLSRYAITIGDASAAARSQVRNGIALALLGLSLLGGGLALVWLSLAS
ncbi:hypothetical protein [Natronorubrum sp. DTA28]|uniref:hypothetical protein n=1 Tax=Natronorubrum sp. DTA28 TaxID=3447019 RepID=UPI003F85F0E4